MVGEGTRTAYPPYLRAGVRTLQDCTHMTVAMTGMWNQNMTNNTIDLFFSFFPFFFPPLLYALTPPKTDQGVEA